MFRISPEVLQNLFFLLLFITIAAITLNPPHIPDYEDLSDSAKKWVDAADTIVLVLAAVAFGYTLRARKKGHE